MTRKTVVREMRGIPFFLLFEYLQEMGGVPINDHELEGPGWHVRLERMEPFKIGSLSVGQNRVIVEVEEEVEAEFFRVFGLKTFRAGG